MARERDYKIEGLRVIACILVICIHVSNVYSRAFAEISRDSYFCSLITNGISRIAVPIFFMISGYFLLAEPLLLRKSVKRFLHVLFTLAAWSLFYYEWNIFYMKEGYNFRLIFDEPVKKHLWFLYAILGMYLTLPFFQCMLKNMSRKLMEYFVVLWFFFLTFNYVLALFRMDFTYEVPLVGTSCYLGYFIMGYILRQFQGRIPLKAYQCILYSGIAFCTIIGITYCYSCQDGEHVEVFFQYRNVLLAMASVLIFTAVMQSPRKEFSARTKSIIHLISKHSFTIYLAHIALLDVLKTQFPITSLTAWVGIPLYTCGIFLATLVVSIGLDGLLDFFSGLIGKRLHPETSEIREKKEEKRTQQEIVESGEKDE